MRRWVPALGAMMLLLSLSCTEQDCVADSECGPGELCEGGECRPPGGSEEGSDAERAADADPQVEAEAAADAEAESEMDAEAPVELEPCTPGTHLGLCTICGADGWPEVALDDDGCPTLDCSVYDAYELITMGQDSVCYWIAHSPVSGRCVAMGRCRQTVDELYCGAEQGSVVARADGECGTLVGCSGTDVPPEVQALPSGTPCDSGAGACWQDGQCSPYIDCTHFDATLICGRGTEPRGDYCDLYVDRAEIFDCNAYCQENGSTCIDSWNDAAGDCEVGNYEGCAGHTLRNQICRCAR